MVAGRSRARGPAVVPVLGAAVLAALVALAAGPARSYESKDLVELRETNVCPRCALSGAPLSSADLAGAALAGADLFAAMLSRADLSGANLSEANLMGANLRGTDLDDANLTGARLNGSVLKRADFSGATLSDAEVDPALLHRALLCDTILPDGRTSDRDCGPRGADRDPAGGRASRSGELRGNDRPGPG